MVPGACASLKHLWHAGMGGPAVSVTLRTTEAGSFFGVHFTQRKPTEVPREGSQPVPWPPWKLLYCHCPGWHRDWGHVTCSSLAN